MDWLTAAWAWVNDRRGYIALVSLLLYNWLHTGELLSRYIAPSFIGFVAALGVELAVVELSVRIGQHGWKSVQSAPYRKTLLAVLTVSAFANVYEGYAVKYGGELTWNAIWTIDLVQGIVGVAATGLLSWVVYRLSDITSTVARPVQDVERDLNERPTPSSEPSNAVQSDPLLVYLASNPFASYADIGTGLGYSKSTASNRVKALMDAGIVSRNGHGWEVHGNSTH